MLRLEDEIFKRGQKRGIEMSKGTKIKQDQSRNKENNTLKGKALGEVFCADKLRGAYRFQTTNQNGFSHFSSLAICQNDR